MSFSAFRSVTRRFAATLATRLPSTVAAPASPLAALARVPRAYPFAFSVGFTSAKTGLADFLIQTHVEKRERLDVRRNLGFWLFGAWFLGGVQYGVYVKLFGRLFPTAEQFATQPLRAKLAEVGENKRMPVDRRYPKWRQASKSARVVPAMSYITLASLRQQSRTTD